MSSKAVKSAVRPMTMLLRQIQQATRRATEEELRDSGLTVAHANVLAELGHGGPRSNAELARLHSVTPQSMAEILASLEGRGLISRSPKPDFGRAMPAELTKEGHSQLLSVHLAMRNVEQRLLNSLSPSDISRLSKLLEACLVSIEKEHPGRSSEG